MKNNTQRIIKFRFWDKDKEEINTIQGELNSLGELETNQIPMNLQDSLIKTEKKYTNQIEC